MLSNEFTKTTFCCGAGYSHLYQLRFERADNHAYQAADAGYVGAHKGYR